MSKTMTITLSDDAYEALRSVANENAQSPEDVAAAAITERFGASSAPKAATSEQQAKEALLALMRERGHLVDPYSLPRISGSAEVPPAGTPERARFEEELGQELSDALEQSGMHITDLIDRR